MAPFRAREAKAITAALLAHVALMVFSPRPPPHGQDVSPRAPVAAGTLDIVNIELDAPPKGGREDSSAATRDPPSAAAEPALPGHARSVSSPSAPARVAVNTPEAPAARATEPPPPPAGGTSPPGPEAARGDKFAPASPDEPTTRLPGLPGLGNAPVWSLPGMFPAPDKAAAAPTTVAPARPTDRDVAGQVLRGSLQKKDQEAGVALPAAGVVADTIASAVRSSAIPGDARATFEVRLGGQGSVESVRLVSSSAGDAATWAKVTAGAKSALASRALQMGSDSRGATVTVKVDSRVQYPAGNKEKVDVQPVCANDILDQIENALKDPNAIDFKSGPMGLAAAPNGERKQKICIPIGVRGIGDAANAGAHARTLVSTSFAIRREGDKALPAGDVLVVDTRVPWAPADPTKFRPDAPKKKKKKASRGP